jgi:Tfp pilus assembly protein PilF
LAAAASTPDPEPRDPHQPYWPYEEALAQIERDSLGAAEASLARALQRDPGYVPALSLLSKLYFESSRHEEAVRLLEGAQTRANGAPDRFPPELAAGLALHYDALDRLQAAHGLLDKLPARDDETGSARVYVTLRGTQPDSAADLAERAVREQARSAANQNNYGITRLRAGDLKAARWSLQRAIELDPRLPGPYYNLAILEKFYAFDDDAAQRWWREYRKRSQEDPDSLRAAFENGDPKRLAQQGTER